MTALDPQKLIGDTLRLGTIETIDLAQASCRVRVGEIVTGDIPWFAARAGATRTWSPPSVGEQCLLICPEGDEEAGLALLGIYSDANPAPSAEDLHLVLFKDGALISYDPKSHELAANLPAGGKLSVNAPGGVSIVGPVHVEGAVTCSETITADQDVVGGGKSLKDHVHTKVQAGGAVSGPPQ